MKQKKKCLFVSSLALSLIFMPQVTSLAIAEEIYTSESTTKLTKESTANAQQKKGVKKQVTKKSIGKKQATRKIATRQVTNKKLDGEINVNGRVFTVNAFDNMIMVYENDEAKVLHPKILKAKSRTSDAKTTTCILSPTLQNRMNNDSLSTMCISMIY